jgi:DNA-binding beta-propeller fold protein YncE
MKKFSFLICSGGVLLIFLGLCPFVFSSETVKFDSEIKDGLTMPLDIAFNSSGQLLVFDANKSIVAFDAEGKKQLSFSISNGGDVAAKVVSFGAMAFTPSGRLVVADPVNSRVQVFNLIGELLFSFGSSGNVTGKFKGLSSVDVDVLGFIYVADSGNKRLQIFTPNGVFVRGIALPAMVADVSIDYQGNIYALLPEIGRIEKFSNDGKKNKGNHM